MTVALIEEEQPEQPLPMTQTLLVGTGKAAVQVKPSVSGSDAGGMPAPVANEARTQGTTHRAKAIAADPPEPLLANCQNVAEAVAVRDAAEE
ncbi:MAG TPA: hypothetical protein VGL78_08140 [Solirubrobacteraceae bacterium]